MRRSEVLDDPTSPSRSDLKESIFEIEEVTEDSTDLTKAQSFILEYFKNKTGRKRLIKRADLSPAELTEYLPNIALFDLSFDYEGTLMDVRPRLLGTAISEFYGELTGVSVKSERVKETSPVLEERLVALIRAVLKHRNAVKARATVSVLDKSPIEIRTLNIPMSENNADIDKVFTLVEVNANYLTSV